MLKAEGYTDLSELIEATKRIKRSFWPSHSQPTNLASVFPRGCDKGPNRYNCNSYGHIKGNCPPPKKKQAEKPQFYKAPKK